MSASLERLKQRDEQRGQQQPPEGPSWMEVLTSILDAVEAQNRQISTLVEQQTKLTGFVKVMDEEQGRQLDRVQQRLEQPSTGTAADARTSEQLDELVTLQQQIAESLAGEDFRRELRALTETTASRIRTADSAADRSTAEVDKLGRELAALRVRTQQFAQGLDLQDRAGTVAKRLAEPMDRAEHLIGRVERLGRWSWAMGGRLLAGGLLLLIAFATVSGVLWGIAGLLGVPEISTAIWAAFTATDPWWGKALWGVAGLGFAGALGYAVWKLIGWLLEYLR